MSWKFNSETSINSQIVDRLKSEILNGTYERGSPFPTVRQLANIAGVNPNTMQKALGQLENEGLLVTRSTTGRFITDDDAVIDKARRKALAVFSERIIREAKKNNVPLDVLTNLLKEDWDKYE